MQSKSTNPYRIPTRLISFFCCSIEEDFVTWKEKLWPSLCEQFGLEQTGGDQRYHMNCQPTLMLDESFLSIRDFRLQLCNEGERDKVFTGEISRFKSYETQKPCVRQR